MSLMSDSGAAAPAAPTAAAPAAGAPAAAPGAAAPAPAAANGQPAAAPAAGAAPIAGAGAAEGGEQGKPGEGEGDANGGKTQEQIDAEKAAAESAAKPQGAPEKYEPFTPPEGHALDPGVIEKFGDVARELNLPQDAAQKLVDQMAPVMAARQAEATEAMSAQWEAASIADKEIGGDNLTASKAYAAKAITAFASPELKQILDASPLGNHPELFRFMVKAGKAISEDKVVTAGSGTVAPGMRTAAEVLYGSGSAQK